MNLRDRIIELRRVKASDLAANAQNWRVHPLSQRHAMRGVLEEIGIVAALVARELPDGTLELIDGHLRAEEAEDEEVPVVIVDLSDEETAYMLSTFDPLGDMATSDQTALNHRKEVYDVTGPIGFKPFE